MELQLNKRLFTLLLSTAYLFVTLTHISLITSLRSLSVNNTFQSNLLFKRQLNSNTLASSKVLLKRIDKNLPKNDTDISQCITRHQSFFISLFMEPNKAFDCLANVALGFAPMQKSILCCFRL